MFLVSKRFWYASARRLNTSRDSDGPKPVQKNSQEVDDCLLRGLRDATHFAGMFIHPLSYICSVLFILSCMAYLSRLPTLAIAHL